MAVFTKSRGRQRDERQTAPLVPGATTTATTVGRYRTLATDHRDQVSFEASAIPMVDGSDATLRNLSPFIMQLEPPLIYANGPARGNVKKVGLYEAAATKQNSYASARRNINTQGFAEPGAQVALDRYLLTGQGGEVTQSRPATTSPGDFERLGMPKIADIQQAVSLASQLNDLANTPPLVLLVNPESISIQYNKVLANQDRTRYGFVMQAWGEEQPRMSITLKCGAYLSGGRGLQRVGRADSAAWQNMESVFQFYRNNGYIYDIIGASHAHLAIGSVSLRYDQNVWYGQFESLSYSETPETENGGLTVQLEFVVARHVDLAPTIQNVVPYQSPNPTVFNGYSFDARESPNPAPQAPVTDFATRPRAGLEGVSGAVSGPVSGASSGAAVLLPVTEVERTVPAFATEETLGRRLPELTF